MAPNAKQHRAIVNEEDGPTPFRWECLCRRVGHWVATRATAERGAKAHESRYAPKPSKPHPLRNVLSLNPTEH